ILFQPDDYIRKSAYWKNELKNCSELIATYKTGCRYYEQQQTDTDMYFLQENSQQPLVFGKNVNLFNVKTTSYNFLLGRLIAMKKYKQFIQEKIDKDIPVSQTGYANVA